MKNLSFETAKNCPQKVTGGTQDGIGKGGGGRRENLDFFCFYDISPSDSAIALTPVQEPQFCRCGKRSSPVTRYYLINKPRSLDMKNYLVTGGISSVTKPSNNIT